VVAFGSFPMIAGADFAGLGFCTTKGLEGWY